MPAAFIANDVAHVTGSDVFGESVTWAGSTVTVIFDDEDVEVQLGDGVAQIQNQPTMIGQTSDFSGIADGDTVVARGVTFKVKNWKRDGQGQIEVFLERQ